MANTVSERPISLGVKKAKGYQNRLSGIARAISKTERSVQAKAASLFNDLEEMLLDCTETSIDISLEELKDIKEVFKSAKKKEKSLRKVLAF